MADFVNRLRMNSIYPENGNNPFGPISGNSFDLQGAINAIYPLISREKEKDRQLQRDLSGLRNHGALHQIAQNAVMPKPASSLYNINQQDPSQQGQINTLYHPLITPFQEGTLRLREKELGLKGELGRGKLEQGEEGLDIKRGDSATRAKRADIYEFKATHPNMQFKIDKGGNFIALDPLTGKGMDTGISSGTMSDAEKLKITGEQRLEQIGEQNKGRKEVQEMRGAQGLEQIGRRIEGQKEIKSSTQKIGELPTQEKVRQFNNARRLMSERPDLSKYIKLGDSNNFTITDSGNEMIQREINDAIFGSKNKDIKLPSDKSPSNKSKSDPLGIR